MTNWKEYEVKCNRLQKKKRKMEDDGGEIDNTPYF